MITFVFPTEIPWRSTWGNGNKSEHLCLFVNYIVESPFAMTRTIPEFDRVVVIPDEKFPEFTGNCWCMQLVRVWQRVKNSLSSIDRITDDNDLTDIGKTCSLVDTTSYCEELCFSSCDVYSMMNHLDNWVVMDVDVSYQSSNLILYTGIWYNNCRLWICWCLESNIVEIV